MRIRLLSVFIALALVMAACGEGETGQSTTSAPEPATTTQPGPEAILLSYSLEPGATFTYLVDLDQEIVMTSEGDGGVAGNEEMPGAMSIQLDGSTTFTQTVAEGPEPGTYEITIKGEFTDLNVEGTVDGEEVAPGDIPDVAEMPPIDLTIVVDEQGNSIPQSNQMGEVFGNEVGGLGALGGLEGFGPGSDIGRLVGPPLPDEPVTVGDSWSESIEVPMMMGMEGDPVTTVVSSEVVGTESVEGREVFVIDTEMITSMIEFDLAEFLIGFFEAFLPDDASEEDRAELDGMMQDLKFLMKIDETLGEMTTLFDPDAGLAREADFASTTHMIMDLNMPDQATGEMMGFVLDMSVDQKVTYTLTDAAGA